MPYYIHFGSRLINQHLPFIELSLLKRKEALVATSPLDLAVSLFVPRLCHVTDLFLDLTTKLIADLLQHRCINQEIADALGPLVGQ